MLIHRRSLLLGLASSLAAPAIVRAGVIMPVKTMIWDGRVPITMWPWNGGSYLSHARKDAKGDWQVWDPQRSLYRPYWPGYFSPSQIPPNIPDFFPDRSVCVGPLGLGWFLPDGTPGVGIE